MLLPYKGQDKNNGYILEVEMRVKGKERTFNVIIPGNFPNLKKGQVHKTTSTAQCHNIKTVSSSHIKLKLSKSTIEK